MNAVSNSIAVGLFRSTPEGRILDANPALAEILGYPHKDDLLAINLQDLYVNPSDGARWRSQADREGAVHNAQTPLRRKDGRPVWVEMSVQTVVSDDEGLRYEHAVVDVSDRIRLEAEQYQRSTEVTVQQALLTAIVDAAPAGIALLRGPEFVFELVNPAFQRFAPDRPMLGRRHADVFPELGSRIQSVIRKLMEAGEPRHFVDVPVDIERRADAPAARAYFTLSCVPLRLPELEVPGLLVLATETTDRVILEGQFRQSQKMEAVGRLAGGVAHDFNNLLTAILCHTTLIRNGLSDDSPLCADIAEILHVAESAARLTKQLLVFSRTQILNPAVVDLNEVVSENQRMLGRILGEDVEIVARLDPHLRTVRVDRIQLEQVLLNLAINARDAMPRGGTLTFETANVVLDETYAQTRRAVPPGPYVVLAVSDTGCGMTPEVQAQIFEPFFTTKEHGNGSGLGLATVYGIVKQSGGHVWVYSEPGHGSVFKVYLPPADEVPEPAAPEVVRRSAGGGETILLVEDSDRLRELIGRSLAGYGYTVLQAGRPDEALRMCEAHPSQIDLLLTDVVMPGMSGRELAECVLTLRPGIHVLYMSGYTDDAVVHHGVRQPGMAFLQKPFTPDVLARKVRKVLAG
jgi:two-component system cell cycle sensor histidine kinase/response regulator CckA